MIEKAGIKIQSMGNADNFDYYNTLIKYKKELISEADRIRKLFSVQIEMREDNAQTEDIVLITGKNY